MARVREGSHFGEAQAVVRLLLAGVYGITVATASRRHGQSGSTTKEEGGMRLFVPLADSFSL